MKRFIVLLVVLSLSTTLLADEQKVEEFNTVREYRTRVFEVQHQDARAIYTSVALLGSGFKGAVSSVNADMRTITVRDFPENLATIEEAIKRLDRPVAATPDIELKISVLIASKSKLDAPPVPEELASVVKQLQSTLRYSSYGLMTATIHRTRPGVGVDGSGVGDSALLGMTVNQERPAIYKYEMRGITGTSTAGQGVIDISHFAFSMNVPIDTGDGTVSYQSVGFRTPVAIRENEKVVIGTTTMGEKALIVVVTATMSGE